MTQLPSNEHLLDNPVWHSLNGPLARFAAPDSSGALAQFDRDVSVFSGVECADDGMWQRISECIDVEQSVGLFRDWVPEVSTGWEEHFRIACFQMIAGDIPLSTSRDVVQLGPDDAQEMLDLVQLTESAPFGLRTREMGRYVGVRRDGRLVAIAGERFRVPGFVEISAVSTHPDARGHGLATDLTLNVAASIRMGGSEACLHVIDSNETALRLYLKLGFVVRRKVEVVFAQWHGPDWQPDAVPA